MQNVRLTQSAAAKAVLTVGSDVDGVLFFGSGECRPISALAVMWVFHQALSSDKKLTTVAGRLIWCSIGLCGDVPGHRQREVCPRGFHELDGGNIGEPRAKR